MNELVECGRILLRGDYLGMEPCLHPVCKDSCQDFSFGVYFLATLLEGCDKLDTSRKFCAVSALHHMITVFVYSLAKGAYRGCFGFISMGDGCSK
jgi:hypothetical protein